MFRLLNKKPKNKSFTSKPNTTYNGERVCWTNHEQFKNKPMSECEKRKYTYRAYGFSLKFPKEGDIVCKPFTETYTYFEVVNVDRCGDPNDMYFVDLKPVWQENKL